MKDKKNVNNKVKAGKLWTISLIGTSAISCKKQKFDSWLFTITASLSSTNTTYVVMLCFRSDKERDS